MKNRFSFFLAYIFFWILFFIFCKFLFLIFYFNETLTLNFVSILGIFVHGLKLDFSCIGYFLILPTWVIIITCFFRGNTAFYILKYYTYILLSIVSLIVVSDLILYKYWGFRLDKTPLLYLKNPDEMVASISWFSLILSILFTGTIAFFFIFLYNKKVGKYLHNLQKGNIKSFVLFLILFPALIVPIRGSFDTAPVNVSTVFFHSNSFANHAAINVVWNLGFSLTEKEGGNKYFDVMDDNLAEKYVKDILLKQSKHTVDLLNISRPNIMLIIIESFTSKLVEPLGGKPGITPNFNKLIQEGVFFTNFYANDSRSDKGMIAILSGYPTQGTTSIIKSPHKTEKLKYISKILINNGYHSAFYYGGDINFANLKSFLINGDFEKIISKSDFKSHDDISRWGVPDHILFNYILKDIGNAEQPFFKVYFTLSNHEPFDIPVEPKFKGTDLDSKLFSAAYYTDSCIGDFIHKAKKSSWWENTLIIMLADHGSRFPGRSLVYGFEKYQIPMLWLGGVLRRDTVIKKYGSQIDLAPTLLNQLNLPTSGFRFGKDLLSSYTNSFAFYAYNNGFGFVTDSIKYVYDNVLKEVILGNKNVSKNIIKAGEAYQQLQYEDYKNK